MVAAAAPAAAAQADGSEEYTRLPQYEDAEAPPTQPWLRPDAPHGASGGGAGPASPGSGGGLPAGGDSGGGAGSGEDEDPRHFELRRADTNSIVGDFQGAGTGVIVAGLALAGVYSSIAAVLVWYSTQVPRTCRAGLSTTFRLMGSLDGVLGVLMVCFFLAAKGLVDAMSHGVLAEKYESEGRTEEAERQKEEAAKKMAGAFLQGCFPTLGFLLLQAFLLGTWIYGIVQAVNAERTKCGSAVTVFWVMLAVNVASALFSSCLEARAAVPRPGGGHRLSAADLASLTAAEGGDLAAESAPGSEPLVRQGAASGVPASPPLPPNPVIRP